MAKLKMAVLCDQKGEPTALGVVLAQGKGGLVRVRTRSVAPGSGASFENQTWSKLNCSIFISWKKARKVFTK